MQPSPYTPGEVARGVPGRAVQLGQMDERLSYLIDLQRLVGRIRVDVAPRGIGKTSLLREAQRRAEARGALTIWVTAGDELPLVPAIAQEVGRRVRGWQSEARHRLLALLEHLTVSVGVPGVATLAWTRGDDAGARGVREFEDVLRETVTSARSENHGGLVLFVDEIQSADPGGLRTLGYAWQHLQSEGADIPAAVFAAGLPNTPEVISSVVTFSERFAYRPLERLSDDAAMVALGGPARALGVEWERSALDGAVSIAAGYPYTVQLIGDATWAAAGYPSPGAVLGVGELERGRLAMRDDLDSLFRARWEKTTPAERRFLHAMAALGNGPVRRADIAAALSLTSRDISVPRARLLGKGLIDVAARGELSFPIPGFADYVRALSATS